MSQALLLPPLFAFRLPKSLVAWLVLGACLIATAFAWLDVSRRQQLDDQARFELQTKRIIADIQNVLASGEQVLNDAAALFANQTVPHAMWRNYVASLALAQTFPAMQEIGFANASSTDGPDNQAGQRAHARNHSGEKERAHIASVFPGAGTTTAPHALSPEKLSIAAYHLMLKRPNAGPLAAPPLAPSIDNMPLLQYTGRQTQGTVLMYLPVYFHNEQRTLADGQRKKLLGYVFARIGIREFMNGMLQEGDRHFRLKVFEGSRANPEFQLFDSKPTHLPAVLHADDVKLSKAAVIDTNGNPWTIQFERLPAESSHPGGSRASIYILGGGLLLAFSLFGIAHGMPLFLQGVMRSVSDRKQPQEELERSHKELKKLIGALESLREEEQKRLAQEMHDDLGQLLAAMKMDLSALAQHLPRNDSKVLHRLDNINELVNTMVTSVRRIISDLPPKILEDLGLFDAIKALAKNFENRHQLRCHVCLPEFAPAFQPKAAASIYRMIQESLNNVAKHASATDVEIRMDILDSRIMLSIADNGKGFSTRDLQKAGSFGLIGMRERAASLSGGIKIESADGAGTTIYVSLPLDAELCCGADAPAQSVLIGTI